MAPEDPGRGERNPSFCVSPETGLAGQRGSSVGPMVTMSSRSASVCRPTTRRRYCYVPHGALAMISMKRRLRWSSAPVPFRPPWFAGDRLARHAWISCQPRRSPSPETSWCRDARLRGASLSRAGRPQRIARKSLSDSRPQLALSRGPIAQRKRVLAVDMYTLNPHRSRGGERGRSPHVGECRRRRRMQPRTPNSSDVVTPRGGRPWCLPQSGRTYMHTGCWRESTDARLPEVSFPHRVAAFRVGRMASCHIGDRSRSRRRWVETNFFAQAFCLAGDFRTTACSGFSAQALNDYIPRIAYVRKMRIAATRHNTARLVAVSEPVPPPIAESFCFLAEPTEGSAILPGLDDAPPGIVWGSWLREWGARKDSR